MIRIPGEHPLALHDIAGTRRLEQAAAATLPAHALMRRAGLATARLALALAPHARRIWVACGPGNNGGDGLEAAMHLQHWGKQAIVTWLGHPDRAPGDARASHARARAAGVEFSDNPPADFGLCIDALLGLGASRVPEGQMAAWIARMRASSAPCLSIDLPSGLDANTGCAAGMSVRADHTLSLLTLKPGLFTADGRDASGQVWFDDLGTDASACAGVAVLNAKPRQRQRPHASHKGSYGDVAVIGGAPGMTGAALLCASAALHGGAGRVYLGLLDATATASVMAQPELMLRDPMALDLARVTAVCGCGGGDAVRALLPRVLGTAARAVIDADALNALAVDAQLSTQLRQRASRGRATVITPHPLEAARLLGCSASQVQADRLGAAAQLAERFQCVVVLKGSGSIIAAPGAVSVINPTGNARLATAGTGDVLAGMVGAALAAGVPAFEAACEAVHAHGLAADQWPAGLPLTAGELARCRV